MTVRPEPQPTPVEKTPPIPSEAVVAELLPLSAKVGSQPVAQDALAAAWTSFANTLKVEDARLFSTLTAHTPTLEGDAKILFQISNPLQREPLQKIQLKLLQHLRVALNNQNVEVEITVAEKSETTKAYTAEDKFVQLSKKNPSLLHFKQQFHLDFE